MTARAACPTGLFAAYPQASKCSGPIFFLHTLRRLPQKRTRRCCAKQRKPSGAKRRAAHELLRAPPTKWGRAASLLFLTPPNRKQEAVESSAQIPVGLPHHLRTKKLIKRLGQPAAWSLVCLILWAGANRSNGVLTGLSSEDIELAADWQGESGAFFKALAAAGFLETTDSWYRLNHWDSQKKAYRL